jgi:hypothetical protein
MSTENADMGEAHRHLVQLEEKPPFSPPPKSFQYAPISASAPSRLRKVDAVARLSNDGSGYGERSPADRNGAFLRWHMTSAEGEAR